MDAKLLEILVCPLCKGPLIHDREARDHNEIDQQNGGKPALLQGGLHLVPGKPQAHCAQQSGQGAGGQNFNRCFDPDHGGAIEYTLRASPTSRD